MLHSAVRRGSVKWSLSALHQMPHILGIVQDCTDLLDAARISNNAKQCDRCVMYEGCKSTGLSDRAR